MTRLQLLLRYLPLFAILSLFLFVMLLVLVGEAAMTGYEKTEYLLTLFIAFACVVLGGLTGKSKRLRLASSPLLIILLLLFINGFCLPRHSEAGFSKEIRISISRPFKPFIPMVGLYALFLGTFWVSNRGSLAGWRYIIRDLPGSWGEDFPSSEELRANQGVDSKREDF